MIQCVAILILALACVFNSLTNMKLSKKIKKLEESKSA